MFKKRILAVLGLSALLLVGCGTDAEYFSELKQIEHVKVVDTGTRTIGKSNYPTVTYISNKTGKEIVRRFDTTDYGFKEYYESAKLFKKETYIDIVVDEHDNIVMAVLSKEVK